MTVPEAAGEPLPVFGTAALMVVEPGGGGWLRVSVVQRLAAVPDHVILGSDRDRLAFPLPEIVPRAQSSPVDFVAGWRRPRVVNGVITDAVPPLFTAGEPAYAFIVQPRGATVALRWTLPYGAADVELLVPERGIRASGSGLRGGSAITERGRRYVRWSAGPIRRGGAVTVRLDGSPPEGRWPEAVAGMLAATLACGLAAGLRRPPASPPGPRAASARCPGRRASSSPST